MFFNCYHENVKNKMNLNLLHSLCSNTSTVYEYNNLLNSSYIERTFSNPFLKTSNILQLAMPAL